ncbi:hypothetical protein F5Y05DRAFT_394749 [Hypoxylon sp. FL0543]|nr:hypothetical protein F5Y05DRAFT_394749 [Hypoxylon sp. FL0543]
MGYKAELPRSLSMLSVLGLSFAIGAYDDIPFYGLWPIETNLVAVCDIVPPS